MSFSHQEYILIDKYIVNRGNEIIKLGFKTIDALHIACAEKNKVDIFFTTDDNIEKLYTVNKKNILVKINNPLKWLLEDAVSKS